MDSGFLVRDRGKGVRVFSVSVSVLGAEECVEW